MPKIKKTVEDYLIDIFTYTIYTFFAFVCVYPFYYIMINSFKVSFEQLQAGYENQRTSYSL